MKRGLYPVLHLYCASIAVDIPFFDSSFRRPGFDFPCEPIRIVVGETLCKMHRIPCFVAELRRSHVRSTHLSSTLGVPISVSLDMPISERSWGFTGFMFPAHARGSGQSPCIFDLMATGLRTSLSRGGSNRCVHCQWECTTLALVVSTCRCLAWRVEVASIVV